jgi:hypothetical protein
MNRVAVWVAHTTVGATAPTALAQATATPLPEIEAGARLDPDIAAQPFVAMNVILGREGMARGALIQRPRSASASDALTAHPVTAANDSGFMTQTVLFRCRRARSIDKSSWAWAVGPSRTAERGSQA